jgi:ribose 5-phosphate isomerase B
MAERVVLASDHAGRVLREALVPVVREAGYEAEDFGTFSSASVDYPDFAKLAAGEVASNRARFAVLVCGTGIGMSMAANKVKGIRAAHCGSELEARLARAHNDANVLCLGERILGPGLASAVLAAFLGASFEGGRHEARVAKVMQLER